jgi:hypothetical protein
MEVCINTDSVCGTFVRFDKGFIPPAFISVIIFGQRRIVLKQQKILMKSRQTKENIKFLNRRLIICSILFIKYPVYKVIANYAPNSRGIPQSYQTYSGKAPSVRPHKALSQVLYQSHNEFKPHGESY